MQITELTPVLFGEILENRGTSIRPIAVDFYKPSCDPCAEMLNTLSQWWNDDEIDIYKKMLNQVHISHNV